MPTTTSCLERTPHGSFVQLIPQYFQTDKLSGCLSFTEEGLTYYGGWYARHGKPFTVVGLTLSALKLDLMKMVADSLDEEVGHIERALAYKQISGLEARVAKALLQADFTRAAEYADLARRAGEAAVVNL